MAEVRKETLIRLNEASVFIVYLSSEKEQSVNQNTILGATVKLASFGGCDFLVDSSYQLYLFLDRPSSRQARHS